MDACEALEEERKMLGVGDLDLDGIKKDEKNERAPLQSMEEENPEDLGLAGVLLKEDDVGARPQSIKEWPKKGRKMASVNMLIRRENRNRHEAGLTSHTSSSKKICTSCGTDKTPQWRKGPQGSKTLCNACGVKYKRGNSGLSRKRKLTTTTKSSLTTPQRVQSGPLENTSEASGGLVPLISNTKSTKSQDRYKTKTASRQDHHTIEQPPPLQIDDENAINAMENDVQSPKLIYTSGQGHGGHHINAEGVFSMSLPSIFPAGGGSNGDDLSGGSATVSVARSDDNEVNEVNEDNGLDFDGGFIWGDDFNKACGFDVTGVSEEQKRELVVTYKKWNLKKVKLVGAESAVAVLRNALTKSMRKAEEIRSSVQSAEAEFLLAVEKAKNSQSQACGTGDVSMGSQDEGLPK